MKKLFLILFLLLILLSAGVLIGLKYLSATYLPQLIKTRITQEAPARFNLNIQVQNVEFDLFKGIVLHNVEVSGRDDPATKLQIERVTATFLILPLFNQKKIIFPTLKIYGAKFDIIRYPDNLFNFRKLIPQQFDQGSSPALAYSFLVYQVEVVDSQISFLDETLEPNIKKDIKLLSLAAQLNPGSAKFRLASELIDADQKSSLSSSGSFNYQTKELKATCRLDKINLLPYLVYFREPDVDIESFQLDTIEAELNWLNDIFSLKATANAHSVNMATKEPLAKDKTIIKDAKAKLRAGLKISTKDPTNFNYVLFVDELNADMITPQAPEKIRVSYAKFEVSPDKLKIDNSIINTLQTKFVIKGDWENFSDPVFNLKLQSEIDLPTAKYFLRTYFDVLNPFIATGKGNLNINFIKTVDRKEVEFKGSLDLEEATLKTLEIPYEVKSINGAVNFTKDEVSWSNLSFNLLDKYFYSRAEIINFASPAIDLELYSEKINLRIKLISKGEGNYDIQDLEGSYFDSKFNSSGNIKLSADAYTLDLNLESAIDLKDLKQIQSLPQEQLSKINAKGKCKIDGRIKGNIKDIKSLTSQLNLSSPQLIVYGYKLADLKMQIAQENQQVKIPKSSCAFYGGVADLNGLVGLEESTFPFALKVVLDSVQLAQLKLDIPLKDENLKGTIFSTTILSGQLDSLQDFKAQGEILIQDGHLWGFTPLKKLGDFLFIPKYETMIFREASAIFSVLGQKIALEHIVLRSDPILLSGEGTIDFKGNLDIDLTPKAVTEETENLDEFEKFSAGIFSESGGLVTVKITGTTKEPKYEKKIIAMQVIGKVKDQVVDKVKAFTDMIFGTPQENP